VVSSEPSVDAVGHRRAVRHESTGTRRPEGGRIGGTPVMHSQGAGPAPDTPAHREGWSAPRVGQRRDMPRVGPGRGSSAPRETGQRTRPASVTTGARRLSLRPIDDEGFPAMTRLLTLLSAAGLALAAATAFAQGAAKSGAPAQAAPPSG